MRFLSALVMLFLVGCVGPARIGDARVTGEPRREFASVSSLAGTYLGEGDYDRHGWGDGLAKPAVRLYLKPIAGGVGYYGVILEYDALQNMALPYLAAQKAPAINKVIGYLDKIATRISVYQVEPTAAGDSLNFHRLRVQQGRIVRDEASVLTMTLARPQPGEHALAGAVISGNPQGVIRFPTSAEKKGFFGGLADLLMVSQFELAEFTYKKAHLKSTWRGDFDNLEGSYLSEYGKVDDGVLELYTQGSSNRMKFLASRTSRSGYTNPKSAGLSGDYGASEALPDMFVLDREGAGEGKSDPVLLPRIGLFLDIFDASAPEAGSQMVVELALVNPDDPADFLMYYQHPKHLKNVGVRR